MGHGMGGQKDFGLHKFAAGFADVGLAAFVFDYRGWGGSGGEPRHWLSARRHMEDWRAAIRHVRSSLSNAVDTKKLALWGTSFAGGHVLVVSSEPEFKYQVTAVVTQVPNLDAAVSTKASIKQRGIGKSVRMLLAGLTDLLRTSLGQPSIYLPLAGLPGSMAFMQMTADELERYNSNHPKVKQGGWRNLARAAYAAEHALFKTSPIKYVANITAPVLFCGADYDKLCPMDTIKRAVELTPNGELYAVACDHFELFTPKHLPGLQQKQRNFLLQHLGSPKRRRQELEQLVAQQQAAEEAAW